jgi:hypothetical protein
MIDSKDLLSDDSKVSQKNKYTNTRESSKFVIY